MLHMKQSIIAKKLATVKAPPIKTAPVPNIPVKKKTKPPVTGKKQKSKNGKKVYNTRPSGKPAVGRLFFDGKDEDTVVAKLESAFMIGATDDEACIQADISRDSLYRYCAQNPEFRNRKEMLKEKLVLASRATIGMVIGERDTINGVQAPSNRALETAKWYVERKRKSEFAPQVNGIIEDGRVGGVLTEERKAEIAQTVAVWSEPEDDDDDERDEDYESSD